MNPSMSHGGQPDSQRATGCLMLVVRALATSVEVFLHEGATFGDRYFGVQAAAVLTTEKDYVRLLPLRPFSLPVAWVPLTMEPEPIDEFRAWLAARLIESRD